MSKLVKLSDSSIVDLDDVAAAEVTGDTCANTYALIYFKKAKQYGGDCTNRSLSFYLTKDEFIKLSSLI